MITSKIKETQQVEEQTFPRLMKYEGHSDTYVVLFESSKTGTIVQVSKGLCCLGEHRYDWIISSFKPFVGTIELTQD